MYNYLEALMSLPFIISVILKITVILGLGWICHFLLTSNNPRWRVLLWRCVIVGILLVPALIPLKYLQIRVPQVSSMQPEKSVSPLPLESEPTFEPHEIPAEFIFDSEPVEVEYNYFYTSAQAPFSLSKWLQANIWLVIFSTWAIVTAIFALRLLTGFFLIKKRVKISSAAPEHIKHLLDQVVDDLDCPVNVNLHYLPEVMTPFLFGYRKPIIIIPQQMTIDDNSSELRAVLAHEVIHLRSQDMFWIFITKLAGILLWFHPLVWKLRDAHNAACEEVCDAVAADYMGSAERYSSALARIALNIVGKTMIVGGIPMAHSSNILKRIKLLRRKVHSNPLAKRSVILYVLSVMTLFVCVGGVKLAYANNEQNERVIYFPEDYSLGRVYISPATPEDERNPFGIIFGDVYWHPSTASPAQGEVIIPDGYFVRLSLDPWTWENPQNMSVLEQFEPDEFYFLSFNCSSWAGEIGPGDECMPYIAHLTGLKCLGLENSNITAQGLEYLPLFESLEQLYLPEGITDAGMVHVGKITTLRILALSSLYSSGNVTNAGLSHIASLKDLENLSLYSQRITDEGLQVLSELPNLRQLKLGDDFTNDAIAYLKDAASLRYLRVSIPFNDQSMEHVAGITQLEGLYASGSVTDEGVQYIQDMPNLKCLYLSSAELTDRALTALKEISTLEELSLQSHFTDEGIKNLTELKNLKLLRLDGIPSNSAFTDQSLAYIGELENLEELNIGAEGFSDEGVQNLAKLIKLKSLLIILHGNYDNITNKSLESLSGLKNLKILWFIVSPAREAVMALIDGNTDPADVNFKNTNIDDEGLKYLSNLTALEDLNISNCSFTDAGLQHLEGLTSLKRIMGLSGVTEEAMNQFREKMPGLEPIQPRSENSVGAIGAGVRLGAQGRN